MIAGDGSRLSFPDICLTDEEKSHPGKVTRLAIATGPHLGQRQRCYLPTRAVFNIIGNVDLIVSYVLTLNISKFRRDN